MVQPITKGTMEGFSPSQLWQSAGASVRGWGKPRQQPPPKAVKEYVNLIKIIQVKYSSLKSLKLSKIKFLLFFITLLYLFFIFVKDFWSRILPHSWSSPVRTQEHYPAGGRGLDLACPWRTFYRPRRGP